jgi:homocysteine S-methyltransferase
MKPWWLSFVFQNGQFPQDFRPNGRKFTILELVRGLCSPIGDGNIPHGIGVNCTRASDAMRILSSLAYQFAQYSIPQPWLVLYPNGGHAYDLAAHQWLDRDDGETEENALKKWVEEVGGFCRGIQRTSAGIFVGGCCRCGPAYVQALQDFFTNPREELLSTAM